jgi:methyl-accepting chemotaxis protein
LAKGLQVAGGIVELLGLFIVALGIAETRRAFTRQASWMSRLAAPLVKIIRKLLGQPDTLEIHGATHVTISAAGDLEVATEVRRKDESLQDRVARLEGIVDRHRELIASMQQQAREETSERTRAIGAVATELSAATERLDKRIVEAATGGLRLETAGVFCFMTGVSLTIWGTWIG